MQHRNWCDTGVHDEPEPTPPDDGAEPAVCVSEIHSEGALAVWLRDSEAGVMMAVQAGKGHVLVPVQDYAEFAARTLRLAVRGGARVPSADPNG